MNFKIESILMLLAGIPAFVSGTVFSVKSSFSPLDTIEWVIDLQDKYPMGIFCPRLTVHLVSGAATAGNSRMHQSVKIAETSPEVPGFIGNYHVGVLYKIVAPVSTLPSLEGAAPNHRQSAKIVVMCVSKPDNQIYEEETVPIVAESKEFFYYTGSKPYKNATDAQIIDLSPPPAMLEQSWDCLISHEPPQRPIRADKHAVYDAHSLIEFLRGDQKFRNVAIPDVYGKPIERLNIDDRAAVWRAREQENVPEDDAIAFDAASIATSVALARQREQELLEQAKINEQLAKEFNLETKTIFDNVPTGERELWNVKDVKPDNESVIERSVEELMMHIVRLDQLRGEIETAGNNLKAKKLALMALIVATRNAVNHIGVGLIIILKSYYLPGSPFPAPLEKMRRKLKFLTRFDSTASKLFFGILGSVVTIGRSIGSIYGVNSAIGPTSGWRIFDEKIVDFETLKLTGMGGLSATLNSMFSRDSWRNKWYWIWPCTFTAMEIGMRYIIKHRKYQKALGNLKEYEAGVNSRAAAIRSINEAVNNAEWLE